jgi:Asp-tRNA(Asn)/Glu-tRNA(Gln) amidotransferase A subunit family amidase
MSKKWYNYFVSVDESGVDPLASERPSDPVRTPPPLSSSPSRSAAQAVADIAASVQVAPAFAQKISPLNSFDEIYQAAEIPTPPHGYTVYKVAEMLQSPHIKELPREIKRSSVLVALEASGVKVEDIVTDAIRRDKALDTFETIQRRAVEQLEAAKLEENKKAQAEVDRVLEEFRARIQANNEAIAKEKERFQGWLHQKHQEEQKIADTVSYFVSENPVSVGIVAAPAGAPNKEKA